MEITDMDVAETIRTSLLAHGCEAVYGQVDWNAVARDVLATTDYRTQEATGAPSAAEDDEDAPDRPPTVHNTAYRRTWMAAPRLIYPERPRGETA